MSDKRILAKIKKLMAMLATMVNKARKALSK